VHSIILYVSFVSEQKFHCSIRFYSECIRLLRKVNQIVFQIENDLYAYQNFSMSLRLMEIFAVAEMGGLETDERTVSAPSCV